MKLSEYTLLMKSRMPVVRIAHGHLVVGCRAGSRRGFVLGIMVSAERKAVMRSGGFAAPSGVQGQILVRGSAGFASEAESFLALARPNDRQICPILADSW